MILVDLRSFMIKNIRITHKSIQLFLGMALGVLVLMQAVHSSTYHSDVQEQQDQKGSEKNTESTLSVSQAIPNTTSQISLSFDSYLLDEVTFSEKNDVNSTTSDLIVSRIHKAMRVILISIVSPNAP